MRRWQFSGYFRIHFQVANNATVAEIVEIIMDVCLPPRVPEPKLFSIFAEKFLIDSADSLKTFPYCTHVAKLCVSPSFDHLLFDFTPKQ